MAALGAVLATLLLIVGLGWLWQKRLLKRLQKELDQFQTAQRAGELKAAERACLRAAGCAKLLLVRRTQTTAIVHFSLAQVLFQQGKVEQAEQSAK